MTNISTFLVFLLVWVYPAFSVKEYLFKKCEQNGFCHRNRHFATTISAFLPNYEPRYSIDRSSLTIDESNGVFQGKVLKQLNDGSYKELAFDISVIQDYNLRFKLDELYREKLVENTKVNPKRYAEASKWAFSNNAIQKSFKHQSFNDEIVLQYGNEMEYKAIVQVYPFRISLYYFEVLQIVMNDRDFLNLEHYRKKESDEKINVLPEESTYNAFFDQFKDSRDDTLPLGPESVALDFTFVNYTTVYGIPEHADSLSLKDTSDTEPYRLYNVDIFEYETQSKLPMYGSIPFMVAVNPGTSAAIFWVNSADTYIDIKKNVHNEEDQDDKLIVPNSKASNVQTHWMSENGIIDVVLMVKTTPGAISQAYHEITGFSKLPNIFSLGYHQCRWNYNDESDVLNVHYNFDKHEIPYDAIWLDIEYTDSKKYFTWNKGLFPDPDRMMGKLAETRRQLVVIVDPHIKTYYDISDEIQTTKIGIMDHNLEQTYHGHCWPGESVWIDSTNPNAQTFWSEQFKNGSELLGLSTNGHLWNDMNEPSIFNGPETSAPKNLIHYDNFEHRSIHNLYGLTFHELTYQALIDRNPNQRPFILTRAFFPGSQRTAAMWTGDNMAEWKYLKESIPMVLTMNVAGFPFAGADVGGFFGNPSKELLVRWYQAGIWYPFFRAHAHIDSRRREPWVAGGEYTDTIRDAVRLRYRLLPEWYTLFWKNSITGDPIIKPLSWVVPSDEKGYHIDNEFYMGGLLVRPVVEEDANQVGVYFPCDNETYYNFLDLSEKHTSCQYKNIDTPFDAIPMFLRGGSVLAMKERYRRSAQLMKFDPYTLYVTIGSDGSSNGEIYTDDGETFNYEFGDFLHVKIAAHKDNRTINGRVIHVGEGPYIEALKRNQVKINKIVLLGYDEHSGHVEVIQNGKRWTADVIEDDARSFLTIRNPGVVITADWEVSY